MPHLRSTSLPLYTNDGGGARNAQWTFKLIDADPEDAPNEESEES